MLGEKVVWMDGYWKQINCNNPSSSVESYQPKARKTFHPSHEKAIADSPTVFAIEYLCVN